MAVIQACAVTSTIENTGVVCDKSLGPTAMLLAVPTTLKFTLADLADPTLWATALIHAGKANRIYPLFGLRAPIRVIQNDKENDVIETLEDGVQVFVRYGFYNRMFSTTSGGLCFAKAMQSLNASGYSFLELDKDGNMLAKKNIDGTYSGFNVSFAYSPAPSLSDFKSVFKSHFKISYDSKEFVRRGVLLSGADDILELMGLQDASIIKYASSTTFLLVGVETECGTTNLVELIPDLLKVANFIVKTSSGTVVTITSAVLFEGKIKLMGTFTSGTTYTVQGALASVLLTNGVNGYEITNKVSITIP